MLEMGKLKCEPGAEQVGGKREITEEPTTDFWGSSPI